MNNRKQKLENGAYFCLCFTKRWKRFPEISLPCSWLRVLGHVIRSIIAYCTITIILSHCAVEAGAWHILFVSEWSANVKKNPAHQNTDVVWIIVSVVYYGTYRWKLHLRIVYCSQRLIHSVVHLSIIASKLSLQTAAGLNNALLKNEQQNKVFQYQWDSNYSETRVWQKVYGQ